MARGTPRPSQIRWRLLPSLARSVGLGPVCGPQKLPAPSCRLLLPATNQSVRSAPTSPAKRSGSVARYPPLASRATAASRSCQNHNPVPAAASPRESRCAGQTEYRRDTHDPATVVCRPSVCVAETVASVESNSITHREAKECSWIEHPSTDGTSFPIPANGKEFC